MITQLSARPETSDHALSQPAHILMLRCPACAGSFPFQQEAAHSSHCEACGWTPTVIDGIGRALSPERTLYWSQFTRDYQFVRAQEGRGSRSADYYLALPYRDLTNRNPWQWRIRAASFRHFERHILPKIERACPSGCDVLDLGAGNCWLSYRLALRGHRPVAIDLIDNADDGLGAGKHYFAELGSPFPRFQAEFDHLPFASHQFDLVVFNASFHYSTNYERTLREAIRCLRKPGLLAIIDSPFYRQEKQGEAMLREKQSHFASQYGIRSDTIPSLEYLTPLRLQDLASNLDLTWRFAKPWYGLGWALRPFKARLLRRRTPSQFFIVWTYLSP